MYVVITSPWHLTRVLVTVFYRYLTTLCFHENCQLVVIISCIWDDQSPLFLWSQGWLNTIHIRESLHNGDTKVPYHLCGYGHPGFLVAMCASTLWYKNFILGLRSCENQPPDVG